MRSMRTLIAVVLFGLAAGAAAQVFDGLVIYNPVYYKDVKLIDTTGRTVKTWRCTTTPGYTVYLMPDSTIWRPGAYPGASMRGGVYGGLIEQYDWSGNVIRSFLWSDANHQQHHDIHPMPNGHVLLLAWARKSMSEAKAMGRVTISGEMWPEEIIEYDPVGDSVVWEWRVWDHLIQDVDPSKPNYGVVRDHPELIDINLGTLFMYGDWIHANIVEYNEERDEIVFSSHFLNEVFVIDHSTTTAEAAGHTGGRHGKGGDIIYRWGNPQNYRRGDSSDQRFRVVHGANWIKPGLVGEGNILLFDNGDRPGSANDYSTVLEITPPLDSNDRYYIHPDSAYGPETLSWFYRNPGVFYSGHMSGAYRMPNGNTFITEAVSGRLFEVNRDGQVVWQRMTTAWNGRAIKYPRDYMTGVAQRPEAVPAGDWLQVVSPVRAGRAVTARYRVDAPGRVRLLACDAAGRTFASTDRHEPSAGWREFRFLPGSQAGGVCFVQATDTRGRIAVQKLAIVR